MCVLSGLPKTAEPLLVVMVAAGWSASLSTCVLVVDVLIEVLEEVLYCVLVGAPEDAL